MNENYAFRADLPPEQQASRDKCIHPSGEFEEFPREDIEKSIPKRFEKIVRMYPDRIAVKAGSRTLTYDELNQTANRIARTILAHLGNGEEPVALLLEHGPGLIAAMLGILKAGKFYVSLDPAFPHTRMAYMLADSGPKLLLSNKNHRSQSQQLVQGEQDIFYCDDIDPSINSGNLELLISPDTCALMLYTSGSTGNPKGVLHNHRNVLVETRNYTNDERICHEDKVALWHSCSFAKSNRNIYAALLNGAALFPYGLANLGFVPVPEWMRANRITILDTLPTTFRRFCETIAADATFPELRVLRLGGESVTLGDVRLFQRHFCPHCVLMQAIGPTETFTVRRYFITHGWSCTDTRVPLGYAVPDKEVLLVDVTGREVDANQIGEIGVRSKYLALGYWRRPDLTQSVFIPDPRGGDERLYLTGDLGMMRPDGCLIHMGRKDFQVKIRGYRVEVAEIEAALLGLDSVKGAVVHAQGDDRGEPRLVAYVVPATRNTPTVSELRRALVQSLPVYMVPSAFVFLDTLPSLPNGKIDRLALPNPENTRPALDTLFAAPRTPIEEKLGKIWAEVLGIDQVGIYDHFFDLGGHSLAATRVVTQVIKTFQLELPLHTLFRTPTVAEMAKVLEEHRALKLEQNDLDRILNELEALSEEDAQRVLAEIMQREASQRRCPNHP